MQTSDNRLVLYESVPKLQDMAAFNIAANLTMKYAKRVTESEDTVRHGRIFTGETLSYETQNEIYDLKPDDLIIPRALEAIIKKCMIDCCYEICRWLNFYDDFDSIDLRIVTVVREFLSNIVWKSNGKIDHFHTALNLVNSSRMKEVVKFHVMCEFCMEEKIRIAWFEMRNRSFVKTLVFWREPLLVYWCCVMTGDFSKTAGDNDIDPVEKRVLLNLSRKSAHFPILEYFLNRLDVDDRIEVGAGLMQRWCGWTRFLISKYTEDEQYRLFSTSNYICGIFIAFSWDISNEFRDDALKTWNHIKNLVTGNQYVRILQDVIRCREWIGVKDELNDYLEEFWRGTPYNLKQFVFQLEEDEFMPEFTIFPDSNDNIFEFYDELVQRDYRVLIAVLSDADLEYRKKFWRRNWVEIVYRSRPPCLKQILNLCVSNDEMAAFKKDAMSSPIIRKYFKEIIERGRFLLLNEFLTMFIDGGQREIDDAKRGLFKETTVSERCLAVVGCEKTEESVSALIEFLRAIFGDDLNGEAKFKKRMIVGCFEYVKFRYSIRLRNSISKIIYVSERICEAALLEKVKNAILKKCEILLSTRDEDRNLTRNEWDEIILWCFGDQQKFEKFKTSCEYIRERNNERSKRRKRCSDGSSRG